MLEPLLWNHYWLLQISSFSSSSWLYFLFQEWEEQATCNLITMWLHHVWQWSSRPFSYLLKTHACFCLRWYCSDHSTTGTSTHVSLSFFTKCYESAWEGATKVLIQNLKRDCQQAKFFNIQSFNTQKFKYLFRKKASHNALISGPEK